MSEGKRLVTIKTFTYASDAGLVQSYLDSEEIPTFLKDEFMTGVYGGASTVGGIKLQVKAEDVERAIQKLKEGGYFDERDLQLSPFQVKLYNFLSKIPILKNIYKTDE